ncbi:PTS system mannose/fructose/N-acetylgalactosamine-transporter subunit IIB [Collinsella sp. wc0529]|uniref:PTS system mannose/fructose/N-acetylgalactosamine-transporter subunit IIB n=1 Tax=Collinsella sp. wc0529 TaxID=3385506 RepID=UPI0038F6616B
MAQPKILLTRIDDRFIYGQDVELWNEAVGSNLVLIVNDEIAADSRKWAPMRVATLDGVWTRFFSVQKAIDIIQTATPRQWILIMVASPADALALVKGGVPITKISIGHMQAGEGKRPATPTVAVDDTDVAAFKELQELGIELEIRYLPSSNPDPIQLVVGDTLGTWGRSF